MNSKHSIYDVIIVGGGLAGLVAAILLSRSGASVLLIEKKQYPFHKVCGEYVSNEVLPFLQSLGFNPFSLGASKIVRLRISTPDGKNYYLPLQMGAFGISRYAMDNALFEIAHKDAVILTETKVSNITFTENLFTVQVQSGEAYLSKFVIGSYGKRDMLDKKLQRNFIETHTGYMAVKYHIKTDYPANEVGLDNFLNGYCGIVKIEEDKYNLCYLYKNTTQLSFKNISHLEEQVLFTNPTLKSIFQNSDIIYTRPETINQIYFNKKEQVHQHILMCGDSAGLITPLCGNGMSMAIGGAKLLCEYLIATGLLHQEKILISQRESFENKYQAIWNKQYANRLFWGRTIQRCFGNPQLTKLFVSAIYNSPLKSWLIAQTHGDTI